jgi:hypothetical protein
VNEIEMWVTLKFPSLSAIKPMMKGDRIAAMDETP